MSSIINVNQPVDLAPDHAGYEAKQIVSEITRLTRTHNDANVPVVDSLLNSVPLFV